MLFFWQHHSRPWQVPWVHWDGWGMSRCSGQCSGEEGGWLQEDQSLTLSPLLTYSFPEPFSHSGLMCSSGHGAVPGGEVSKVWLLPGCWRRMELGQGRALLPQGICKEDWGYLRLGQNTGSIGGTPLCVNEAPKAQRFQAPWVCGLLKLSASPCTGWLIPDSPFLTAGFTCLSSPFWRGSSCWMLYSCSRWSCQLVSSAKSAGDSTWRRWLVWEMSCLLCGLGCCCKKYWES